jgi:hypothetical protein
MMPDEEEPTPEELEEAAALARALDRGQSHGRVPEDALTAAHLLRYAKDGGALGPVRSEAILADVLERARPPAPSRARRFTLAGLLALGAAAGAALYLAPRAPVTAARLPEPPMTLLSAQADAARARASGVTALSAEMGSYRARVYATLEESYSR